MMWRLRYLFPYYKKLCRISHYLMTKPLAYIIVIFVILMTISTHQPTVRHLSLSATTVHYGTLVEAVAFRASSDRYIVLSLVDEAYADMAINLYETSLRPHHINNYLFVGIGQSSCDFLARESLACFRYVDDQSGNRASAYGSAEFIRKMRIKNDIITEALSGNFTVIYTDLDVYFLSNPLDEIREVMLSADIASLWDIVVYNAGFIIVKPTNVSKVLYHMIPPIITRLTGADDQRALNVAIKVLRKQNVELNLTTLNTQRFLCARNYFEKAGRWFAPKDGESCDRQQKNNCAVVVHNDWIVTKEAKVYRFREHLMWMYDGDDKYYSSNTRLYLAYINHAPTFLKGSLSRGEQTAIVTSEITALKTAMTIGYLLNRTVVLPRFHTGQRASESPLNSVLHVKSFDDEFAGKYRENSFLRHPKVPPEVRSELSKGSHHLVIDRLRNVAIPSKIIFVSAHDIKHQFGHMINKVLQIGSLQNVNVVLRNCSEDAQFGKKLSRAFYHSDYRQYKRHKRY